MKLSLLVSASLSLFVITGCQEEVATRPESPASSNGGTEKQASWSRDDFKLPPGIDAAAFVLSDEPDGVQSVIAARETVQNDDEVSIIGRIGGDPPWVEGRAAFTIVDPSLKACSDIPGDECPKPWDYCCETHKLPTSTALVVVVDENDNPVKADTRALLDVRELSTVVVKGKAKRDDNGNLTVFATGVYVKT